MRHLRTLIAVVAVVVLALAIAGCTGAPTGAEDGLHSTVPDVQGMTQTEAVGELTAAGYVAGEMTVSTGGESGKVMSQDPVAGTSAPRKTAVDLVISQ